MNDKFKGVIVEKLRSERDSLKRALDLIAAMPLTAEQTSIIQPLLTLGRKQFGDLLEGIRFAEEIDRMRDTYHPEYIDEAIPPLLENDIESALRASAEDMREAIAAHFDRRADAIGKIPGREGEAQDEAAVAFIIRNFKVAP